MFKDLVRNWYKTLYHEELEYGEELFFLENMMEKALTSLLQPIDSTNFNMITAYQTRYLVLSDLYKKVENECE